MPEVIFNQQFIYQWNPMFHQRTFNNRAQTIIINADDYGIAPSIDQGIIELLLSGRVTSLSAIVNEVHSQEGAKSILKLKYSHPEIFEKASMGLHFNLTRGQSLSQKMRESNFTENGKFQKSTSEKKLMEGGFEEEIADQLRQQIKKFINLFKRRPSHLDGHNHVHIYPSTAKAIARVLSQFGIYRVRLPSQKDLQLFGSSYQFDILKVRQLFSARSIIWPVLFLGTEDSGNLKAFKIKESIQSNKECRSFELMCHPGYPDQEGKGWTSLTDRLNEKNQLQSEEFISFQKYIDGFSSYLDLRHLKSNKNPLRLLIYSKLEIGTGNYTTTMRLKAIFQNIGFQVFTWSAQSEIQANIEAEDLQKFLIGFGVSLILGINVSRSAKIIYEATHSSKKIRIQVPYVLLIAGTDANYTFQDSDKYQELFECLQWCQCLVSLSKNMTKITENVLKELKIQKHIYTIVQSSCLGQISQSQLNGQRQSSQVSNRIAINSKRTILFPTSFRRIKCVEHVLRQLNELIQQYPIQVKILGPIIEKEYYNQIKGKFGRIIYAGTLSQSEYSKLLSEAFVLINCSETEGMSCSILEALQFGVPVVVRKNAGNLELINHGYNGLIYQTSTDFLSNILKLCEDQTLRNTLISNGKKIFNENYSLNVEQKRYHCMIEKEFKNQLMELSLNGENIRILNQPNVHHTSQINNQLYLQISPKINGHASILDFGCGTSVFTLLFLLNADKISKIKLFLVDISDKILGNAIYNCRQSSLWSKLEIVAISQTHFLKKIDKKLQFDAILFNPPQTPFRKVESRLDKNGGINGIKFYQQMFRYFSESSSRNLYILNSYMAWPSRVKELMSENQLECVWSSQPGVHKITRQEYDQMEQNLSQYIFQHWRQGKAEISFQEDQFFVPAKIMLITQNNL